jgi:hypothetical protein
MLLQSQYEVDIDDFSTGSGHPNTAIWFNSIKKMAQSAPVETLLNCITGKLCQAREKQIPRNIRVNLYSLEASTPNLVLPATIAGGWIFNIKRSIWKGKIHKGESLKPKIV